MRREADAAASVIRTLAARRALVFTLVKRDLKVRYKASALGFLWSFGKPLFLMLTLWAVFSRIVRVHTEIPYTLHLLTGLLPWMFLQGAIGEAQYSILSNANVVKKVFLPTVAFPTASILSNLVHFLLALSVLFAFILVYCLAGDWRLFPRWELLLLPFLIALQALFLWGISLIVSSLNVFYRDVSSITEIVITAWFYLTPIIYPVQDARSQLKGMFGTDAVYYLYLCNPMTPIIVAYRRVLYGGHLSYAPEIADGTLLAGIGISLVTTLAACAFGMSIFNKLSRKFADEL